MIIKIFIVIYILMSIIGSVALLYKIGKEQKPTTPGGWLLSTVIATFVILLLVKAYLV